MFAAISGLRYVRPAQIVRDDQIGIYHCIARCVRRAFLSAANLRNGHRGAHRLGIMALKEVRIMATDTTKNQSWVQKTPGVCGGRACIRNTRITVWGVVNSRRLGAADEQILENIVGLTPADLHAAWDYYREHPAEIDEDIRDNEAD